MNFPSKDTLHRFALDNWNVAIEENDFERAIALDQLHYNELVKKFEDVKYWDKWQQDTLLMRQRLTRQFEKINPSIHARAQKGRPVLIVHHNFSGLAHETQLARNIKWLQAHGEEVSFEIVYLFGKEETRPYACEIYGISPDRVHYLEAISYQAAAAELTKISDLKKVNAIIYPTIFYMAFWMSLFVPHPNQKFVQMKYYPMHAGRINQWAGGYRCNGTHYRINGYDFEQLPILDLKVTKNNFKTSANPLKEVTIGSISRPEKICNPDYNRFILKILDLHHDINYLYTGRPDAVDCLPRSIIRHPRSKPLGWVEPSEAIGQFSIYLEPFPWGGGEMTLLALNAGIPYLTLDTAENSQFGIYGFLRCLAHGKDPILQMSFPNSPSQLLERLSQLIKNYELRQELGHAWREATENQPPPYLAGWRNLFNN